ncbi:MAG TPA: type I methionyl aminopeptidase [Actinomycetota bacterium]
MIITKSEGEIATMRRAGEVVAEMIAAVRAAVRPGVSTADLDAVAAAVVREHGATASFVGYRGFPATICASINDEIVHGIPSPDRVLAEGDLFKGDFGAIVDGFHADAAVTIPVGEVSDELMKLIETTERALWAGIAEARPGNRLGDIGHAVQTVAEGAGFSVVREYVGHGIGRALHEDPPVPNYGTPGKGIALKAGLVIAIEPMVNAGTHETRLMPDKWTVKTADGALSAHFEHTIAITENGPWVLTDPGRAEPRL